MNMPAVGDIHALPAGYLPDFRHCSFAPAKNALSSGLSPVARPVLYTGVP